MAIIKINYSTTFLPLKNAKGTVAQRFEHATRMNDQFHEMLKENFVDGEMSRVKFIRLLKKCAGGKIPISDFDINFPQGRIAHFLDKTASLNGYVADLPKTGLSEKVSVRFIRSLLATTQKFFTEILNPKILKREVSMYNKGQNLSKVSEFFEGKIRVKGALEKKELNKLLKPLTRKEKIDTLQLLRYRLQQEHSVDSYRKHYMRKMNKTPRSEVRFSEEAINSNAYMYPEKLEIIEQELAKVLQKARSKK